MQEHYLQDLHLRQLCASPLQTQARLSIVKKQFHESKLKQDGCHRLILRTQATQPLSSPEHRETWRNMKEIWKTGKTFKKIIHNAALKEGKGFHV